MITIRAAAAEDIEAMAEVQAAGWKEGFAGVVPPELAPSPAQLAEQLRERFGDTSRWGAAAEVDGEIRGLCLFGPSRDADSEREIGEVYVLFVDPSAWRRGVGRALVEHALAELREREFREVTLWSAAENYRANAFYEQLGFCHDGAEQSREQFGNVKELRYRRSL